MVEILSMDGGEFKSKVTPTEARKVIFEDVLGFTQAEQASVTLGYNRGRISKSKIY